MDDVAAALAGIGIDSARIHTERFGSTVTDQPRRRRGGRSPAAPAARPARHRSGGDLRPLGAHDGWSDAYASVLELAEACDVPTRWSCRTGVCHTCVTAVLSGRASYQIPPLEAPGDDELLICSAQPTTDLVVDL